MSAFKSVVIDFLKQVSKLYQFLIIFPYEGHICRINLGFWKKIELPGRICPHNNFAYKKSKTLEKGAACTSLSTSNQSYGYVLAD